MNTGVGGHGARRQVAKRRAELGSTASGGGTIQLGTAELGTPVASARPRSPNHPPPQSLPAVRRRGLRVGNASVLNGYKPSPNATRQHPPGGAVATRTTRG